MATAKKATAKKATAKKATAKKATAKKATAKKKPEVGIDFEIPKLDPIESKSSRRRLSSVVTIFTLVFVMVLGVFSVKYFSESDSSQSAGSTSNESEASEENAICANLEERIASIENKAKLIELDPNVYIDNFSLAFLGDDLGKAGIFGPFESSYVYADVLNLLEAADYCLSDRAVLYLNNYLELPVNVLQREIDGN